MTHMHLSAQGAWDAQQELQAPSDPPHASAAPLLPDTAGSSHTEPNTAAYRDLTKR